ncbi:MAG TPA: M20/M25/M40 family metallo-hydrolase [Thermomicrobiales bacterium]|jgi:acetylornithine deacetylase/succinyl-diaminopimelate desuccinylase-like protein
MTAQQSKSLPGEGARSAAAVRDVVSSFQRQVIDLACQISAIPAPTNNEHQRSRFVAEQMAMPHLVDVTVDELGDVIGRIPGRKRAPALLLAAHLDTVFPSGTALDVNRSNGRVAGPGIGDNSLGVASVLTLPKLLAQLDVVPEVDILLTGNVGEEGLGNLRGIRSVMDRYPEIGAVIAVEGHNLGRVTHVAVGSRRLRVRVSGPGGHSWGDFGNASAIHAAADIVSELARLPLPTSPKTTLNVGTFNGGISVNTIAPEASFVLDLRSVDEAALRRLSERVDAILRAPRANITTMVEVLGVRPAGVVSPASRIVRLAIETLESMGISPTGDASSTDANIPISRGIPAVCIGLTTGGHVHREDEFIDVGPVASGLTQLVLLSLAVTAELGTGSIAPIGAKKRVF